MRVGLRKRNKYDHYFLGLQELEIVKSFKYLGVDLQYNLLWASTKWRFASKARARIPMVTKAVIERLPVNTCIKLWEMVRPHLSMRRRYGEEVTGHWRIKYRTL